MTNGIKDTKYMKEMIGSRLQAARGKISRQKLTDILNSHEDRPVIGDEKASLSLETLKKWEYGENPINIEWLPVICKVLDCDIGYLFGEYEEKRREVSDVCAVTGLSSSTVKNIMKFKKVSKIGNLFYLENVGCLSSFEEETPIEVINSLLEDAEVLQLLYLFFVTEDTDTTGMVKNTRSNAILIELLGILLNKRKHLQELIQSKREEMSNGSKK